MMKVRFLFLVLILFMGPQLPLSAQDEFRMDWGPVLKAPNNSGMQKVFGYNDQGFYALRLKPTSDFSSAKVYFEKYDREFNLKRSNPVKLKYKGKELQYVDLLPIGGKFHFLTSYFNKSHKKNYLFVQEVLPRQLQPSQRMRMIAELPSYNMFQEGNFGIRTSEDSSYILIHAQIPERKNDPEQFAFYVYDRNLEKVWKKQVRLPYPGKQFSVEDVQVDEKGNVYVLGVVYQDGTRVRRQGKPNYQYVVIAYREQGENKVEYRVGLDDRFITDLTFKINRNGDIVCAGFYSDRGAYSVKGTYYMLIDGRTKEILRQGMQAFDIGFLTTYLSENKQQRAREAQRTGATDQVPELYRYALNDLILRSDGGAVLIAEQYYVNEDRFYYNNFNRWGNPFWNPWWGGGMNPGMNNFDIDYYFNYNDIIVTNIRPDGSIEWASRIPKQQETINDGGFFSSYVKAIAPSSLMFLYNDHPANANPDGKLRTFTGNRAMLMVSQVKKDGGVIHTPLRAGGRAQVMARPKASKQTGRREILLYGEWGRNFQFGRLIF